MIFLEESFLNIEANPAPWILCHSNPRAIHLVVGGEDVLEDDDEADERRLLVGETKR